ncbi:hypothetical protein H257_08840 [Aphanomyces astaci]|uniref:Uncharacterized protein n=1 Tax=Aphanomyces astaci TaxID=112090 RepID=W4GDR9_APHAT|nr:hypothetical protein H257_08840 [Aphanomyces astaci]ETV77421.1 hypothetical protein H257_08840 [Aphanomyces astaci]|eukprot:XP_009833208.1 hypothetical protein H257_08840 [Aphanomyces astaci]
MEVVNEKVITIVAMVATPHQSGVASMSTILMTFSLAAVSIEMVEVNNDLPFKQAKNTTKTWDAVADKLCQVPGFGKSGLDRKKAPSRFYQFLRVHRKFQVGFKYLSGVKQDDTGKIMLLDELFQLFDEASDER